MEEAIVQVGIMGFIIGIAETILFAGAMAIYTWMKPKKEEKEEEEKLYLMSHGRERLPGSAWQTMRLIQANNKLIQEAYEYTRLLKREYQILNDIMRDKETKIEVVKNKRCKD